MGMKVKLLGFIPDVDQATPGIIVDCDQIVPSLRGVKGAPSPVSVGLAAADAAVTGAAVITKLDASTRLFLGSEAKIEEATSATALTDRSAGGGYTGTSPWRFAQFGDITLATNKAQAIQSSTTGSFATVTGAPRAAMIDTVGDFVFAFDTVDGTFGTNPDGWWCCAQRDSTDWTPDIQTQSARGNLQSVPGPITGGKRLGDSIVAYKQRGMFIGTYVGPPAIWTWQEIPGSIGAWSQESIVPIGNAAHVFVGYDDFYWFDGSRPVAIGEGVREFFFSDMDKSNASKIKGLHDFENKLIYFFYPSVGGGGAIDSCIVYNYQTRRWGLADRTIEATIEYVAANVTYDNLGSLYSTYADLPSVPYDSFFTAGRPIPAIINTSHVLQSLDGATSSWYFTTGDFGDEINNAVITKVKPRFKVNPTTSTLTNYYRQNLGDALTEGATTTWENGRYDVIQSARWHRGKFSGTGNVECYGFDISVTGGGLE